jgi:hypothetical protein
MDNVQNCDSYINIPSSQTYRSYLPYNGCVATNSDVQKELTLTLLVTTFNCLLHETQPQNFMMNSDHALRPQ